MLHRGHGRPSASLPHAQRRPQHDAPGPYRSSGFEMCFHAHSGNQLCRWARVRLQKGGASLCRLKKSGGVCVHLLYGRRRDIGGFARFHGSPSGSLYVVLPHGSQCDAGGAPLRAGSAARCHGVSLSGVLWLRNVHLHGDSSGPNGL